MSWVAVAVGGGAVLGAGASIFGAKEGSDAAAHEAKKHRRLMSALGKQFQGISDEYTEEYKELSEDFDPMDLQQEFDLLYEAVILPMERDFSEKVLPQIRQGYSGGGYGSNLFSGGREVAEAEGRQNLSMNTALLRMQGREAGIARNFQEYDRRRSDLGLQFGTEVAPLEFRAGAATSTYGAAQDAIAAKTAAWGQYASAAQQGLQGAATIAGAFGGTTPGAQDPNFGQTLPRMTSSKQGLSFTSPIH